MVICCLPFLISNCIPQIPTRFSFAIFTKRFRSLFSKLQLKPISTFPWSASAESPALSSASAITCSCRLPNRPYSYLLQTLMRCLRNVTYSSRIPASTSEERRSMTARSRSGTYTSPPKTAFTSATCFAHSILLINNGLIALSMESISTRISSKVISLILLIE